MSVCVASNELPESQELNVLYDRFLFRCLVKPVSDDAVKDLFNVVLKGDSYYEPTLTEELTSCLSKKASRVILSVDVVCLLRYVSIYVCMYS
jgi:MoxR-like ATPase